MPSPVHSLRLVGLRVLVVEDDYVLAEELRQALVVCGAEVLGPFPDIFPALVCLAIDAHPEVAILDVNLGDELVFPLADALQLLRIPIVFATASARADLPPEYRGELFVQKPTPMTAVLQALGR